MAMYRDSNYLRMLVKKIGDAVKKKAPANGGNLEGGCWYGSHMSSAARAIAERISLVDFVLDVRDARIPLSSECHLLSKLSASSRRIIVMNKMDLADRSQLKEWKSYFEQHSCISYGVNSHNKDSVKEFLQFLQTQVRKLKKTDYSGCSSSTSTVMMVGIPNVGKSALANSLHRIGRISAAEKGKLKHAIVSPHPGETKDISSLKIGSHPNIYVLDTPGVLPPEIGDVEVCSKLALTGAIRDCWVGEKELAQYFLAILNLSNEYKKWVKLSAYDDRSFPSNKSKCSNGSESDMKTEKQYSTDHTQDFVVNDVRHLLFEAISHMNGDVETEKDLEELIKVQFGGLTKAFQVSLADGDAHSMVAIE